MAPNPAIMKAVEKLDYRVTVGDVATQAGLKIEQASQGLLALASDAQGHLQVADDGEIVYLFPRNFRDILRNKYLQLQLQDWWNKVWGVLFYVIRLSFGIFLIVSIALIYMAIIVIISSQNSDNDDNGGGYSGGFPLFFPDIFWYLSPGYGTYNQRDRIDHKRKHKEKHQLNFLEAVFSFLFGDGNPNPNLEERRFREIAGVIRKHNGAIVAEQIAPYLDDLGEEYKREDEDYMLPVLTRFNGQPQVSPEGQIIYYFPELQVSAAEYKAHSTSNYLQEHPWKFSRASSEQKLLSAGLGIVNIVGAFILINLNVASAGGFVGFVKGISGLLLAYGFGFLAVPLIRNFWIQMRNNKIRQRNQQRMKRANLFDNPDIELQQKISFSRQFANQRIISQEDLIYNTQKDLLEQEVENSAKTDAEWERRLKEGERGKDNR